MATPAQIEANRRNAQHSTGPRTPEGKAAAAQNRVAHGFTGAFRVLPSEDREEYLRLLQSYLDEYEPSTPTENFFVAELAQSQWRIQRASAVEAELLNPGNDSGFSEIAAAFRDNDAISRLGRYAQAARRAYYKALDQLQALRRENDRTAAREEREAAREEREAEAEYERSLIEFLDAPPPGRGKPVPISVPPAFAREIHELSARFPDFDPERHAAHMSSALRRWLGTFRQFGKIAFCDSNPISEAA